LQNYEKTFSFAVKKMKNDKNPLENLSADVEASDRRLGCLIAAAILLALWAIIFALAG